MCLKKKLLSVTVIFVIIIVITYFYGWKIVDMEHSGYVKKYDGEVADIYKTFNADSGVSFYMEYEDMDTKKIISLRSGMYEEICKKDDLFFLLHNDRNKYVMKSIDSHYHVLDVNGKMIPLPIAKEAQISKFSVEDGIYNVGLLDKNTNTIYQSTAARIDIKKDSVTAIPYLMNSAEIEDNINDIIYTTDVKNILIPKELTYAENLVKLNGLIALSEHNSTEYSLFVNIYNNHINNYYRVPLHSNEWVEKNIDKKNVKAYFNPVFDNLSNEQSLNIRYLFYEDEKVYTDNKVYYYQRTDDKLKLIFEHQGYNIQHDAEQDVLQEKFIGIDKNGSEFLFRGAIYKEKEESSKYDIIVEIKNETGSFTYRLPKKYSNYMAKSLGEMYAYSHILLPLSNEQLSDTGTIKLYLKQNNEYYTSGREYEYSYDGEKYRIAIQDDLQEQFIGIDKDGNAFIFRGAIYKENEESNKYDIIVEIKNETGSFTYNLPKKYSNYMAKNLGEMYAYSHILLPLSNEQLLDTGTIKLYLKQNNQYYTSGHEYEYSYDGEIYHIKDK